ncbi:hypothetical protein H4S04_004535 [Coemansia sp. S16]|nr:hypothetical protein H4S03_002049 [Coemansia sp. S3946]KAJ2047279.1 hypothetical protein H4S04_004535 [Coemansia sp. S16]KAJ2060675.1 hypothetical protein GGI08_002997 [Coemansia sp. S2]
MADSKKPDYLKLVEPYIQRAQETRAVDPVVSYFCKYYAARLAITSSNSTDGDTYLVQLLDQLEAEKQSIIDSESMRDDSSASAHVTNFALRVFAKADTEDREGRGSKVTAKTFMIASQFLQVLASFGEIPVDIAEKIKYAKWRAMEILKAAREGRSPLPVSSQPSSEPLAWPSPPSNSSMTPVAYPDPRSLSPPPPQNPAPAFVPVNSPAFIPPVSPPVSFIPPVSSPAFIPVPAANLPPPMATPPGAPLDPDQMLDPAVAKKAQKLARWAISALEYDDVSNAIENLQEAIKVLLPYKK